MARSSKFNRSALSLAGLALTSALALTACSSNDPLADKPGKTDDASGNSDVVVIGTANFPESEIIGQIWKEALKEAGIKAEVKSGIGSREVYLQALQEGSVDIVPEYTGNLVQYFDKNAVEAGSDSAQVGEALTKVLPAELEAAKYAEAESKDAYMVTKQVAEQHSLKSLADLANLDQVRIAGNPELAERPYGPKGLTEIYNVPSDKLSMVPISDGGGPLTIATLTSGKADVADIYTTSPLLDGDGNTIELVALQDPNKLILPQNVVPLMRKDKINADAKAALEKINQRLITEELVKMNERNVGKEKAEPSAIAKEFVG